MRKKYCLYRKDTRRLSIVCNICASGASIIKYVYCIPLRLLKWQITCNQFANGNRMYYLGPYLFWLVKCHKFFTITTVTSSALFEISYKFTKRITIWIYLRNILTWLVIYYTTMWKAINRYNICILITIQFQTCLYLKNVIAGLFQLSKH